MENEKNIEKEGIEGNYHSVGGWESHYLAHGSVIGLLFAAQLYLKL